MSDEPPVTRIVYRFTDAPVAPEFHRSFTISVDRNEVRLVVDRYGEVLAERRRPVTGAEFAGLVAALGRLRIGPEPAGEPPGERACSGGTTRTLVISSAAGERRGWRSSCAGREWGNVEGDLDAFAGRLGALVPGFEALVTP